MHISIYVGSYLPCWLILAPIGSGVLVFAERIWIIAKLQKLLKNSLHKNTHINSQCLTNKTYSKKLNLKSINKVGYLIGIEGPFIWGRVA